MKSYINRSVKTKKTIMIIIVTAFLSAACALVPVSQIPSTATVTPETKAEEIESVSVAANSSNNTQSTNVTPSSTAVAMPLTPPPKPTTNGESAVPTRTKNAPNSSVNGQLGSDTIAPEISQVGAANPVVYYGDTSCGTTAVVIQVTATDNTDVDQVWMNYLFSGETGGGDWHQVNFSATGKNQYELTLDIAQAAATELQGSDGVLEYQVFAKDSAGNTKSLPEGHPYGVEIRSCGVLGNPPADNNYAITIGNVQLYPTQDTIYYGACGNEPTLLNVQTAVDPLDQIASVKLMYTYSHALGMSPTYSVPMTLLGIGEYAGDIETVVYADATMGTEDGNLDFYIRVQDKQGRTTDSPLVSMNLAYCAGVPDLPPAAQLPTIQWFNGPNTKLAGETVFLEWEVQDACKIFLDGNEVNAIDNSSYTIPSNESTNTYVHTLTAWGSSCSSDTEITSQVIIQVQSNSGNSNGNGNGTVSFINNSSLPIVSLVIDGVEMFPSDPQAILAGDTYEVAVSDGNHTYTASNGWWEFGSRNRVYDFSDTFSAQDGTVIFKDATIQDLLTNWGASRYFQSSYMADDGNFHFVGFCFYADGTFREYDDAIQVDSGSYHETARHRDTSTITVNLTGQTVSVDALYYEMFALLDIPRGNVVDEYAPDETVFCP